MNEKQELDAEGTVKDSLSVDHVPDAGEMVDPMAALTEGQEPVAYMQEDSFHAMKKAKPHLSTYWRIKIVAEWDSKEGLIPLYTSPQQEPPKPLTPEQVQALLLESGYDEEDDFKATIRAHFINGLRNGERAHGITGDKS